MLSHSSDGMLFHSSKTNAIACTRVNALSRDGASFIRQPSSLVIALSHSSERTMSLDLKCVYAHVYAHVCAHVYVHAHVHVFVYGKYVCVHI